VGPLKKCGQVIYMTMISDKGNPMGYMSNKSVEKGGWVGPQQKKGL